MGKNKHGAPFHKRTRNPINKWPDNPNRQLQFSKKEVQMASKHMEKKC
jgi:hypothetical protein